MNESDRRVASLLGICRKASVCSMGHDAAKGALRRGQAKLCLVCADASARLAEEFRFLAEDTNTPLRRLELTSLDMKAATQYKAVVLTIDNRGFAEKITGILEAQASTA